jgi:hypothetical protein
MSKGLASEGPAMCHDEKDGTAGSRLAAMLGCLRRRLGLSGVGARLFRRQPESHDPAAELLDRQPPRLV